MTKQIAWNEIIYEEFTRLAMLSEFEKKVLKMRIKGYSITQQAIECACSTSTISRVVAELKEKYDAVQPYSAELPRRRYSAKEKWMDEN